MIVETKRLIVRPVTESDRAAYGELLSMPEVASPAGQNMAPTAEQLDSWFQSEKATGMAFAIVDKATNRYIGSIVWYPVVNENGEPDETSRELGYLMRPEYWGQGLMTEALRGSIQGVRQHYAGLREIRAAVLKNNTRSLHVLEKLNFQVVDPEVSLPVGESLAPKPQVLLAFRLDL